MGIMCSCHCGVLQQLWYIRSFSPDKTQKKACSWPKHWICFLLEHRWKTQHERCSYYFSYDRKACGYQQQTQTKSLHTYQVSKQPYTIIPCLFLMYGSSCLQILRGHAGVSQPDRKLAVDAGLHTPATQDSLLTCMFPTVPAVRYHKR